MMLMTPFAGPGTPIRRTLLPPHTAVSLLDHSPPYDLTSFGGRKLSLSAVSSCACGFGAESLQMTIWRLVVFLIMVHASCDQAEEPPLHLILKCPKSVWQLLADWCDNPALAANAQKARTMYPSRSGGMIIPATCQGHLGHNLHGLEPVKGM